MDGPNLNFLGIRKKSLNGSNTLETISRNVRSFAEERDVEFRHKSKLAPVC